jgi:hypothetical protein
MRKIGRTELDRLLANNVCEIFFMRRRPERAPRRPEYRKMVCSTCNEILNSENGVRSLNFRKPEGPKKIDERFHNVVVVWDLFMQDYRNVSMERCYIVQAIPPENFWEYYNNVLYTMSANEKMQYMDDLEDLPTYQPKKQKRTNKLIKNLKLYGKS